MSKNKMFSGDFSPYDALMELNERMARLEHTHNNLAREFQKTSNEFTILLEEFNNLQTSHLNLAKLVGITAIGKYTSNK
jgi:hypothetical protein